MKLLNKEIDTCEECPYCQYDSYYTCHKDSGYDCYNVVASEYRRRIIDDHNLYDVANHPGDFSDKNRKPFPSIPDWCALPNHNGTSEYEDFE